MIMTAYRKDGKDIKVSLVPFYIRHSATRFMSLETNCTLQQLLVFIMSPVKEQTAGVLSAVLTRSQWRYALTLPSKSFTQHRVLHHNLSTMTERRGQLVNISASYLGGPSFKSRYRRRAVLSEFFVVFLSLSRRMPVLYLKLGHDRAHQIFSYTSLFPYHHMIYAILSSYWKKGLKINYQPTKHLSTFVAR
jgi:hypothetical protein